MTRPAPARPRPRTAPAAPPRGPVVVSRGHLLALLGLFVLVSLLLQQWAALVLVLVIGGVTRGRI